MEFELNQKIFREYDIRGIADSDLADPVVERLGKAISKLVRSKGGKTLALGRDCRLSSERIARVLTQVFVESGLYVTDVGLVPTPLLYYSVHELKTDSGIMVTGSHNPAEYNGLKVCIGPSTIHGEQIQHLKHLVLENDFVAGNGSVKQSDVRESYLNLVTRGIRHPIELKVVVDSGNGMAGLVAPELYRRLGCDVVELFSELDGRFPNHHPDPTVAENLETLVKKTKESRAVVGIGFDGDADRIGAVDPSGRMIFGDELLVLYARQVLKENPGATIISEVKASHRLFQDIARCGGKPILWKTGHSLIKAKMKESGALLAGEMSGHMFFNDRYFGYDDAIYAGARLLEILAVSKRSPADLLRDLPPSFATPEIRVDCPDDVKFGVVNQARDRFRQMGLSVNDIDGARIEFPDAWGLVRPSNTQPVLVFRFEASTQSRLNEIRSLVETEVSKLLPNK